MSAPDDVCITLDVDWADEEVLEQCVSMLGDAGLRATFFATHPSEVLAGLDPDRFEVGLHPNFPPGEPDLGAPLAELKRAYPDAVGARSHSLVSSSPILQEYVRHGLSYESNIFLLHHPGLRPVLRFDDLVSIPFKWSDDKHLELGLPFDATAPGFGDPGLKVLNFHPIHLALNSRDPGHYAAFRDHSDRGSALRELADPDGEGIATLFAAVAAEVGRLGLRTSLMREVRDLLL